MYNFWFTWANNAGLQFQTWSFLDSGNYFRLAPASMQREQNQFDIGDTIRVLVDNKARATMVLTGQASDEGVPQWILVEGGDLFSLARSKNTVTLSCAV